MRWSQCRCQLHRDLLLWSFVVSHVFDEPLLAYHVSVAPFDTRCPTDGANASDPFGAAVWCAIQFARFLACIQAALSTFRASIQFRWLSTDCRTKVPWGFQDPADLPCLLNSSAWPCSRCLSHTLRPAPAQQLAMHPSPTQPVKVRQWRRVGEKRSSSTVNPS